jgi:hypothetical protein
MIELIQLYAWHCSSCGWKWFDRKDGVKPKRCPRRSCRKAGNGPGQTDRAVKPPSLQRVRNGVQDDPGIEGRTGDTGPGAIQRSPDHSSANTGTVDGSVPEVQATRWLGPKHSATCKCMQVQAMRCRVDMKTTLLRVNVPAWKCSACEHTWIPRSQNKPQQCPNRECRARFTMTSYPLQLPVGDVNKLYPAYPELIGALLDTAQANHCCGCGLKTRTPADHNCPHGICAAASCTECGRLGIAERMAVQDTATDQPTLQTTNVCD